MIENRFEGRRLSDAAARAVAMEMQSDREALLLLRVRFARFLAAEGIEGEALELAMGEFRPPERRGDRFRRFFGFALAGLSAACLVFSIGVVRTPSAGAVGRAETAVHSSTAAETSAFSIENPAI
jgi:hypothetical protein